MDLDVFGVKVECVSCDLGIETDGEFVPDSKLVKISDRLSGSEYELTLLHEYFHSIFSVLGFDNVLSDDVEELLVINLSEWVNKNYKRNSL